MLLLNTWGPVAGVCSRRHVQMGALQVMCTWIFSLVGICGSRQAGILYCWNCITYKYRHGLVVRLWDGNHSNLGSNLNRTQRSFAQILTFLRYHYYIIITSLLLIITSVLHHYYIIITSLLLIITHYYNFIITYYSVVITLLLPHQ